MATQQEKKNQRYEYLKHRNKAVIYSYVIIYGELGVNNESSICLDSQIVYVSQIRKMSFWGATFTQVCSEVHLRDWI